MFTQHRAKGIILQKRNLGEADQLFTVYSKEFGRIDVLGKAIRKIKSKLRSGMETFYLSDIEFIQGKVYKTLTDAFLVEKFKNIRQDLEKLAITYKISEVFRDLIGGQEPDENIWRLLNDTFYQLNAERKVQDAPYKIYYYFFWNFVSLLGYEPQLYNCIVCERELKAGNLFFAAAESGIICRQCSDKAAKKTAKEPETAKVDSDFIKILRIIIKRKLDLFLKLKIQPVHEKLLKDISNNYFSYLASNKNN